MAGSIGIKVEGAREVRKALKYVEGNTRSMTAVHRQVAQGVVPLVAARTRRASGDLAGSWRVRASAAKASIGSALVYAPVQEFGWPRHNITPSLALSGAVEDARPQILAEYTAAVADVIAKAEGGAT